MKAKTIQLFWNKVEKTNSCWNWTAHKIGRGYGSFRVGSKMVYAHRVAYEIIKGKIPDGLDLDHLCRNIVCVNPDHLEAVTRRENLVRGNTIIAKQVKQTHCKEGHPLSGDNLYFYGFRRCRKCHLKNMQNYLQRKKKLKEVMA